MERYEEGTMSLEEERELERLFLSDEVPAEWAYLRPLFARNATLREEHRAHKRPAKRTGRVVRYVALTGGVAAAAVVALALLLTPHTPSEPYAIINGERVTDLEVVAATVGPHLERVGSVNERAAKALRSARKSSEMPRKTIEKLENMNILKPQKL